ncbi:Conserved hypothetical protein [Prochlorococcus marinus str. MIT 9303]|uniref:Uncharacterized protein n=1 Tax=Prochlorococcus marinus (strain MIT 9303) TaxID=59922 RepID=A2CDS4_PROM3|nr:Conserved hypothetical protein [Prochlorococcus marinus str. MIT 9303]KGG25340.1 hypothetical protein EV12_2288 [Prochlorococcus sp. MIT 0701]
MVLQRLCEVGRLSKLDLRAYPTRINAPGASAAAFSSLQ